MDKILAKKRKKNDHAGGLHYSLSEFLEYVGKGAVYWSESAVCNEYSVTGGLRC